MPGTVGKATAESPGRPFYRIAWPGSGRKYLKSTIPKRGNVYEYTEPQVRSILEALGCRIKLIGPAAANLIPNHWQWRTEDEVRTEARKYKKVFDEGKWIKQPENLHILAEKG